MKRIPVNVLLVAFTLLSARAAQSQCFRKGSLLVSISEGSTFANYTTNDVSGSKPVIRHSEFMRGDRDPLILEYGLSQHIGVGLSAGTDLYQINGHPFYSTESNGSRMTFLANELTVDVNYHVFTNKRLDLSVFLSPGLFNVSFRDQRSDAGLRYNASGSILRFGAKARYYFWKRLGAFGMVSSFAATASPKQVADNTIGRGYSTSIDGIAIEAGLCFRILR